jgi:hypothetical protein
MSERNHILTASRIDLILILLPIISADEAAYAMTARGVSTEVVARVLSMSEERRSMVLPECAYKVAPEDNRLREGLDNDG